MSSDSLKNAILAANVRFHEALVLGNFYEMQPFLGAENRSRVRRILEGLAREGGTDLLLDIGCGTGFILSIAYGYFRALAGVDISEMMLGAVGIPDADLRVGQAEALPFSSNCANVVTLHGVLHHLHDMEDPFREIYRCLKPGGVLYADESPNARCLRALHSIDLESPSLSKRLRIPATGVQRDVEAYQERFGLDPEVVRLAMYRDKVLGGIEENDVRSALEAVGFTRIEYKYRWFIGQGGIEGPASGEMGASIEAYLRDLLPLSSNLFKYASFIARKG